MRKHQKIHKERRNKIQRVERPKESTTQNPDPADIQMNDLNPRLITPDQLLYLQRTIGNAAVQRLLADAAESASDNPAISGIQGQENGIELSAQSESGAEADTIQRQFQPVTTNNNAHLRNDGAWKNYIGPRIDEGSEVVVDTAQQRTQKRKFISNVTWTKAVNVTGANWDWAADNNKTTYIRHNRIGGAKQYPQKVNSAANKPPGRANIDSPQLNWHHLTGEFVEIEDSVSTAGSKIALHKGAYKSINPATGVITALDADEQRQIDSTAFEAYLLNRLRTVVSTAIGDLPWRDRLVTDDNLKKIMYAKQPEGSKALRFDDFGKSLSGRAFVSYYKWVTAVDGPFARIREGAEYVRDSLEHWRTYLNPPDGDGVTITSVNVNGSDLHEHGLGVLFVKFNKPAGGPAEYTAPGEHEMVVKPEERVLEQKLFGTEAGSLASHINAQVGLAGPAQITTYKQKLDAGFGTLCEKVVGTRAKDLPTDQVRPITQALKESLIFVLITGLTDLHGENILWRDGKPYMIDADNALKLKYMTPDESSAQNGYVAYSNKSDEVLESVYQGAVGYETAMLQALQNPGTEEQRRLLMKVKEIFTASVGRTVPIETAVWGGRLKQFIMTPDVGLATDAPVPGKEPTTKWQWCNYFAATVPTGKGGYAPGLNGEVGVRRGTNGNFLPNVEAAQLFADFKVGQIPFYNYRYADGKVLHNGQVVWDGQPIAERMESLFALFPRQLNL